MIKKVNILSILMGCLFVLMMAPSSSAQKFNEHEVKSAFVHNFIRFVTWPEEEVSNNTIRLGIVGRNEFVKTMKQNLSGQVVNGMEIKIIHYEPTDDLTDCNSLFIADDPTINPKEILKKVKGKPILTISETPDFCSIGGMINFKENGNKYAFEINPSAARKEGLIISSKLLQLATIVKTKL